LAGTGVIHDLAFHIAARTMMYSISLRRDGHIRRYEICTSPSAGWEVKLEADRRVARYNCYRDWHRVERARAAFALEVSELTARGWEVVLEPDGQV
jgi:hypothetical protein